MSDAFSKAGASRAGAAPEPARVVASQVDIVPPGSRTVLDVATLLGLIGGFALIGTAMSLSGSAGSFVDIPSVLIVLGGTLAVVLICYSLQEVMQTRDVLYRTLFRVARDPRTAATWMLHLSETARAQGVLALERYLADMQREPFLHRAVQMVVDGSPAEEVDRSLRQEMAANVARQTKTASVLRKAAEIAPAMGLIGTLVGLVQMLGNLNDPTSIGPAMAIALLTTFYGAVLAYMIFAPLASKLERNLGEEQMVGQIYLLGALSIARQEHPRRLEMQVNTILPPAGRVSFFD
ncbi:motility protein A [Oceanibaculum pacificum]|uniref:motility protein A n=1 Tax=Oceanibaculum pacificum TaxID=580166 RepID=UPI0009FC1D99|nr:MotA/TolQ/ExbB proton channel family protein [Oceanibaculum pacificum]